MKEEKMQRDHHEKSTTTHVGWLHMMSANHNYEQLQQQTVATPFCIQVVGVLILSFLLGVIAMMLMMSYYWFLLRPLYVDYPHILVQLPHPSQQPAPLPTTNTTTSLLSPASGALRCDLSRGEWVPDTSPPLYTNDTCATFMNPNWNCLGNGRPDMGYLQWRWKPSDCELPHFNSSLFLELLRGKKLAIIGDSLAHNHFLSLLCALKQVAGDPLRIDGQDGVRFLSYNFTLGNFWSPYLVQYSFGKDGKPQYEDLVTLDLDIPEKMWASQLHEYDIAVISTGYWYFRSSLYRSNNTILGASPYAGLNITTFDPLSAYRMAMETVLKHLATTYQGITMLRTVVVDHFEEGVWNSGGTCNRTHPFSSQHNGTLPQRNKDLNKVQVEEFEKALALVNGSSKFEFLDVTYSGYLRPDAHPSLYRKQPPYERPYDCLHSCLPGPIDMWNQLVLHTLQSIYR